MFLRGSREIEALFEAAYYVYRKSRECLYDDDFSNYYLINPSLQSRLRKSVGWGRMWLSLNPDLRLDIWATMTKYRDFTSPEINLFWWDGVLREKREEFLVWWLGEDPRK